VSRIHLRGEDCSSQCGQLALNVRLRLCKSGRNQRSSASPAGKPTDDKPDEKGYSRDTGEEERLDHGRS